MQTKTQKLTLAQLHEKVEFYESILNKLPAIIYINEIEQKGSVNKQRSTWANKWGLDFIGYDQNEITEIGYDFGKTVTHPEDFESESNILNPAKCDSSIVHYRLNRHKPKNQKEYLWVYQRVIPLNTFPDGSPKQYLNVAFELVSELNSDSQLIGLFKEVSQLKNKVKLNLLTKRETGVIKLISKGLTDKEISNKLCISVSTAKTHRNRIIKKLKLKNSAAVAAFAAECGV